MIIDSGKLPFRTLAIALAMGLVLASCSPAPRVQMGKTTESELIQIKGEPQTTQRIDADTKSLLYPEGVRYQSDNGLISTHYRDPKPEERRIQYWRHRWSDVATEDHSAPALGGNPSNSQRELKAPSLGQSVTYRSDGTVTRVIEYAP